MLEEVIYHHIQKSIIYNLLIDKEVRFAQLKPKELESNIFMYHLNQLIKKGWVEKTDKGYSLTKDGKRLADRLDLKSLKVRIQPKVIIIIAIQGLNGEWLLVRRKHQPFINYVGFPSVKLRYGETLLQAAQREATEETGIEAIELSLKGNIIMRFHTKENEVVNHFIGYIYTGKINSKDVDPISNDYINSFWGNEKELFKEPAFKGHKDILELLKNQPKGTQFFKEFDYESEY